MKILNIKIEEFGCLYDKSYEFSPLFNLATGKNESGKSTLLAFIKFIFYGLPKKTLETAAERDRSFGWKSGTASGSLTIEDGDGGVYTVYRRAVRKKNEKRETVTEECRIIDEKSGTQVHKDESPADVFIGFPASVFESTCFVRQMGVTDVSTADVGSALENILMSADESINLEKSLERLEGARKLLLHKKGSGGLLSDLEAEKESLTSRLDRAKINYEKLLTVTEAVDKLRKDAAEKRKDLTRLEALSAEVGKAATVKRFDALRENEQELEFLESELDKYRKNNASESGFIPDMAYVGALRESLRSINDASAEFAAADKALAEADSLLDEEHRHITEASPLSSDDIRLRGGIDMICGRLKDSIAEAESKKKKGASLLVASGVTLALSAGLVAASFPLAITPLLFAGIGAAALSAIFAVLGTSARSASTKLMARTDSDLTALGAPDSAEASYEERIDSLRNSFTLCLEREERLRELMARSEAASSVAKLRKKDLDSAEKKARALVEKWRALPDSDLSVALQKVIKDAEDVISRSEYTLRKIVEARSHVAALRVGLEDVNEADVRARVSPVAMKIFEEGKEDEVEKRRKYCSEALRITNEKAHSSEMDLIRLEGESENPARLAVSLEENRRKYNREKLRFDAIMLAMDALSEAGNDIRSTVSPVIRDKAEGYMATLTDQKYTGFGIDEGYAVSARTDTDGVRAVELLSAGTRDAAYLSLRLSLLEVIFRDDRPFLALDEALAQLDDKRAAAALRILAAYCRTGGQCIIFTCHSREKKLLEDITDAKIISL